MCPEHLVNYEHKITKWEADAHIHAHTSTDTQYNPIKVQTLLWSLSSWNMCVQLKRKGEILLPLGVTCSQYINILLHLKEIPLKHYLMYTLAYICSVEFKQQKLPKTKSRPARYIVLTSSTDNNKPGLSCINI